MREPHNSEENEIYEVLSSVIKAAAIHIKNTSIGEFESFEIIKVHKKEGIFRYRTSSHRSKEASTLTHNTDSPFDDVNAIPSQEANEETLKSPEPFLDDIFGSDSFFAPPINFERSNQMGILDGRLFEEELHQQQESKEDSFLTIEDFLRKLESFIFEAERSDVDYDRFTETDNNWMENLG